MRKHIDIPNFYSGQYHQTIYHDTYFSDCIFSFIFWQKSSILRISLKKFLSLKVFKDFSNSEESLSLSLSSVFFLNPKILRLRSIIDLRCNTGKRINILVTTSFSLLFSSSGTSRSLPIRFQFSPPNLS